MLGDQGAPVTIHRPFHRLILLFILTSLLIGGVPALAAPSPASVVSPAPAALQQDAQRFSPSADTTIAFSAPDGNFNDVPELLVNDGGLTDVIDSDALLQFDLSTIPADAVVLDAQLRLVQIDGSGGYSLVVSRVEEAWDAATVTWNNQPVASGNFGFRQTTGDGSEALLWDVTTLVRRWSYTPDETPNHGLRISGIPGPSGQGRSSLHSLEADAALRPVLSVSWQLPPSEIAIPLGTENIELDSFCDTQTEYADALAFAFRDADSTASQLFVKHTNEHLYLCVQGRLSRSGEAFFSAYLDVDNGRDPLAEPDDLSLRVRPEDGETSEWIGNGEGGYEQTDPRDWQASASAGDSDNAEYRIPLPLFELYCGAPFGLALYHQDVDATGDDYGWPSNEFANQPQTWLPATLAERGCPFRVRVLDNDGLPSADATVYRLMDGEATGQYATDEFGFVQDGGVISATDALWALAEASDYTPLSPELAKASALHYTSGAAATQIASEDIDADNIYRLRLSEEAPLLIQDVEVSAQWVLSETGDADLFTSRMVAAANYLYQFTNGQVTLGQVTVAQEEGSWQCNDADLCLYSNNNLRPKAVIGGVVDDVLQDPNNGENAYNPGPISMGSEWNRYFRPPGTIVKLSDETLLDVDTLEEDWPLALAHEFGHYLFFLYDTYLDRESNQISQSLIASCAGSAMNDVYAPANHHFVADQEYWDTNCGQSLAHAKQNGRPEWETMRAFHPWMQERADAVAALPVSLVATNFLTPTTPLAPLQANQIYDLGYRDAENASLQARAYLFRNEHILGPYQPVPDSTEVTLGNARLGDQLCFYDINDNAEGAEAGDETPRHQFGCEAVVANDNVLDLTKNVAWAPLAQVSLSSTSTTSVDIEVWQPLGAEDGAVVARFYAEEDGFVGEVQLAASLADESIHRATFDFGGPLPPFFVQLFVDEEVDGAQIATRRETVFERGTGGGGAFGPFRDWGGVLIYSADGLATFTPSSNLNLKEGESIAWQTMPGTPPLPANASIVGQSYRLDALPTSLVQSGTIGVRFFESGSESVRAAQAENEVALYRWTEDGNVWSPLNTTVETPANAETGVRVAFAPSEGVGVYALLRLSDEPAPQQIFMPLVSR